MYIIGSRIDSTKKLNTLQLDGRETKARQYTDNLRLQVEQTAFHFVYKQTIKTSYYNILITYYQHTLQSVVRGIVNL